MNNRYDFVYIFEVTDGNPNGDPDAGNLPRVDPETGQGLVTDVCLKRKVRNYVALKHEDKDGFGIYVKERAVLNSQHDLAWQQVDSKAMPADKKKLPKEHEKAKKLTDFMCKNFFDIRTFGAVMTMEVNCGQVRGPIQFSFARSIDPVVSLEHAITRCAVTNERDLEKERTIGRKFTIPFGLYRAHGFINPKLAEETGFGDEDFALFKEALGMMFEHDRSAARGQMAARRCIAFCHESQLGNAPAHKLFDRVSVGLKDSSSPPRGFDDYEIAVDTENLPEGITVEEWI